MNILTLHSNQVMTGTLFFISILPFIALRLNGSKTASYPPITRKTHRSSRNLVVGSAICVMLILPPAMAASAEEVFVVFTGSGPEVYQVDTMQNASLTLDRYDGPLWPMAVPDLRLDKSLFVTLRVNNKPPVLLPGFQNTETNGFVSQPSKIDQQLTRDQEESGKQVATSPLHKAASEPAQSQQMVHQSNLEAHPSIPN